MIRRLPPLGALRAFEAAARLGSFSAAADELSVTHGAVSRQIRNLEEWLGVELFARIGKRVRLTDEARTYLAAVQAAFDGVATATQHLQQSATSRRLVVSAPPNLAMRWLLPRLTRFQRQFPGVELRLSTSDLALADSIEASEVAIRRGPDQWPGYERKQFLVEYLIPVASPALLQRVPLKQPSDLARHTLLHADTRRDAWARWFAAAGVPRLEADAHQHFDRLFLTLQAAIDGLGVALGPTPIVEEEIAAGRLAIPLAAPSIDSVSYWWVVPKQSAADRVVRAFCAWLEQEASASPPL